MAFFVGPLACNTHKIQTLQIQLPTLLGLQDYQNRERKRRMIERKRIILYGLNQLPQKNPWKDGEQAFISGLQLSIARVREIGKKKTRQSNR